MKILKSEELRGKYHCSLMNRLREEIPVTEMKADAYDNAVIGKQILHGYFTGEFDVSEFKELVSEGVEENSLPEETNKGRINRLADCLTRYVKSEVRKGNVNVSAKDVPVSPEYMVHTKPDAIFETQNSIEAVKFFMGKPKVTQTGKKQDLSVLKCPEIYALYLYAKSLLKPGESKVIKGSYYYMRKATDTASSFLDNDFFSGYGGNIVFFEKEVTWGKDTLSPEEINYIELIKEHEKGLLECSEEDCGSCAYSMICNYKKTPVLNEFKAEKSNKKIVYSKEQEKIINFRNGIARVIATAGAGKTECVAKRGEKMFKEGIKPEEMLFITFTNAGAAEMKSRIAQKCNSEGLDITADDIQAMTFNALAYNIVKYEYAMLGFKKEPVVIDEVREGKIITQLLRDNPVTGLDYISYLSDTPNLKGAFACTKRAFDIIKSERIDVESVNAAETLTEKLREAGVFRFMSISSVNELISLYGKYQERLLQDGLIAFSDQEPFMFKVLEQKPDYLEKLGIKHLVVDEFQDSNAIQMDIVKEFTKCSCFESLVIVGDDSQSIYRFRHAVPENMLYFYEKLGMDGIDLNLSANRRCTAQILDVAKAVESLNVNRLDKPMKATKLNGEPVIMQGFYSKDEEYDYITETVKKIIDSKTHEPEEVAVLAYTKAELIAIGAKLSDAGIPWVMKNPMLLSENDRVKAAISIADAFYQPEADKLYLDYLAVKYDGNILKKGFDEINAEIADLKNQFISIDMLEIPYQKKLFHDLLDELDKNNSDEVYQYFLDLVYNNEDLQSELEYIQDFKVFGEKCAKKMEQDYKGIVLTTAHSAKGLEWEVVINTVTKYDSKRLHTIRNSVARDAEVEEIRRLLFVSFTRAKEELFITGQYTCYTARDAGNVCNQFLQEVFVTTGNQDKYIPVDPDADKKKAARLAAKTDRLDKMKSKTA